MQIKKAIKILWHIDPLIGNDCETNNDKTDIAWQQPAHLWTGWKEVFSARSVLMATHATMDKTTSSGVFYMVHAKGLQAGQSLELSIVVGYSPDGKDICKGHC
jgi:hypothetical protein